MLTSTRDRHVYCYMYLLLKCLTVYYYNRHTPVPMELMATATGLQKLQRSSELQTTACTSFFNSAEKKSRAHCSGRGHDLTPFCTLQGVSACTVLLSFFSKMENWLRKRKVEFDSIFSIVMLEPYERAIICECIGAN